MTIDLDRIRNVLDALDAVDLLRLRCVGLQREAWRGGLIRESEAWCDLQLGLLRATADLRRACRAAPLGEVQS